MCIVPARRSTMIPSWRALVPGRLDTWYRSIPAISRRADRSQACATITPRDFSGLLEAWYPGNPIASLTLSSVKRVP